MDWNQVGQFLKEMHTEIYWDRAIERMFAGGNAGTASIAFSIEKLASSIDRISVVIWVLGFIYLCIYFFKKSK